MSASLPPYRTSDPTEQSSLIWIVAKNFSPMSGSARMHLSLTPSDVNLCNNSVPMILLVAINPLFAPEDGSQAAWVTRRL
jgi:hypothetical protein